jgi:hypothetical protein
MAGPRHDHLGHHGPDVPGVEPPIPLARPLQLVVIATSSVLPLIHGHGLTARAAAGIGAPGLTDTRGGAVEGARRSGQGNDENGSFTRPECRLVRGTRRARDLRTAYVVNTYMTGPGRAPLASPSPPRSSRVQAQEGMGVECGVHPQTGAVRFAPASATSKTGRSPSGSRSCE